MTLTNTATLQPPNVDPRFLANGSRSAHHSSDWQLCLVLDIAFVGIPQGSVTIATAAGLVIGTICAHQR